MLEIQPMDVRLGLANRHSKIQKTSRLGVMTKCDSEMRLYINQNVIKDQTLEIFKFEKHKFNI